jgi:hypothetical protein
MSVIPVVPNRKGAPRTKISFQEWFGVFAKMTATERQYALDVMNAVHSALPGVPEEEPPAEQQA